MRPKKKTLYQKYLDGEISWELSQEERRQMWKEYYQEVNRVRKIRDEWPDLRDEFVFTKSLRVKIIPAPKPPELPGFPEILRDLTCGAKTRKGTPCKLTCIWDNGRCKFHGGMSTGPKTKEGRIKVSKNAKKDEKSSDFLPI